MKGQIVEKHTIRKEILVADLHFKKSVSSLVFWNFLIHVMPCYPQGVVLQPQVDKTVDNKSVENKLLETHFYVSCSSRFFVPIFIKTRSVFLDRPFEAFLRTTEVVHGLQVNSTSTIDRLKGIKASLSRGTQILKTIFD